MTKSKLISRPKKLSLDLINVEDSTLLSLLKSYHNQSTEILFSAFIQNTNISELVLLRAKHIDIILKKLWQYLSLPNSISLIAVGGYGRAELHPQSDIDLLILNENKLTNSDSKKIEIFITLLWDVGLIIGHSVRTIKQCVEIATDDITVATSLTEARLLMGDRLHFDSLMTQTAPSKIWDASSFLKAKVLEKRERYERFDGSSFDLEPNIKSSPGGLRDIHLVGWLAKRCYYPKTLPMLIKENLISKREYYTLIKSQLFLWKVRFALHSICRKPEDRLLFDHQKKTAELMGFKDSKGKLGVEKMMKRYYRSVLVIRNVTELLVELMKEGVNQPSDSNILNLINLNSKSKVSKLDSNYQIIDNRLDAIDPKLFSKKPSELLDVFQVLAKMPNLDGLTAKTLRSIRASRNKVNSKFRKNREHQKSFLAFWSINHQSAKAMFLMKRSGILAVYLPKFRKITGQMQYDMFHSYTVDEHTLFLLRNLAEFTNDKNKIKFPYCHEIMSRQKHPELIYLAGLFHDIGKGRGGDHSEIGERIAIKFCQEHELEKSSTELISWLVANHLIMSLISQKRDTSDPKVIGNFADIVENKQRLELLYILTVADIRATSKSLWNSWKDALLKDLYLNTLAVLESRDDNSSEPVSIKPLWYTNRKTAKSQLLEQGYTSQDIDELWELLGNHYFSKRSVEAVLWQTKIVLDAKETKTTLVGIRKSGERNSNEIFIYTKDKDDLFANLTATLNQLGLNIYGAHIYTDKNGYCYDSFFFLNDNDKIIKDVDFQNKIVETVKRNIIEETKQRVSRRMPRQIKHFDVDTKISISNNESTQHSRVDIVAKNKPGLLASVGRAFVKNGIKIHDAKITTLGEKIEDSFLITDKSNNAITDLETQKQIIETLNRYLN
ncbi:MAG: [protein-PII] uridylyltransferase [Kangiella sp.]|nr:MAG: [protein-PII] uridylyltransferase [Kangiella sp.]